MVYYGINLKLFKIYIRKPETFHRGSRFGGMAKVYT
jgi:hypothetical protein